MGKSKISLIMLLALSLFVSVPFHAAAGDYNQQQIVKELESLKQTITDQQKYIEQLRNQMNEMSAQEKAGEKGKAFARQTSKVALANDFIDQLKLKGDLRVRYERRDRTEPSTSNDEDKARDRFRTRLRLGGVWQNKTENWEIGAGVATGGTSGTSTNDTWGDDSPFESGDLRLDYAYAKHKINDFAFTLGQQKNPFVKSWLIWDGDLRPTGLTVHYSNDLGLFTTLSGYVVKLYDDDNTAMMFAGQAGYKNEINNVKITLAAGYQHYDSVFSDNEAPNPDYDFHIADIYAQAEFKAGDVKISPYVQIWSNLGADGNAGEGQLGGTLEPEDEDLGWVAGLGAKFGKVKLGYAYAVVGADSIYGELKDADFGTGISDTDLKGHKISASYGITKNMSTGITAMLYEADERDNQREVDLYQLDVKYKF
jgi:hypothetical protein